jgi:hypothetical protein
MKKAYHTQYGSVNTTLAHAPTTDPSSCPSTCIRFTPTLQKPEEFRVKASEGEVVVLYFEPSATQDLKSSGFPRCSRVNNMATSTPSFEFTNGDIEELVILL